MLLTDGPFAETKDQIGGFSVIDCVDLDEAIELAAAHPWARVEQIEIRPVWQP
ncbi:YciI family protein [Nonomuraea sp. NPDC049269]|uniref:YciI family protein n=1 Tax=Nonomuraea sp. NPDC049269 TaxID=3364349 RepID=UPI003718E599